MQIRLHRSSCVSLAPTYIGKWWVIPYCFSPARAIPRPQEIYWKDFTLFIVSILLSTGSSEFSAPMIKMPFTCELQLIKVVKSLTMKRFTKWKFFCSCYFQIFLIHLIKKTWFRRDTGACFELFDPDVKQISSIINHRWMLKKKLKKNASRLMLLHSQFAVFEKHHGPLVFRRVGTLAEKEKLPGVLFHCMTQKNMILERF